MNENIDAITANEIIQKTQREYLEKENKKMSDKANLGKSLTESLEETCGKFSKWMESNNVILEFEESFSDLGKNRIVSVDTFEIDLKEKGIDVSEWEESIKPVKAIMSVITRKGDGEYGLSITMGNMIMLMEDGTFRISNDKIANAEKNLSKS